MTRTMKTRSAFHILLTVLNFSAYSIVRSMCGIAFVILQMERHLDRFDMQHQTFQSPNRVILFRYGLGGIFLNIISLTPSIPRNSTITRFRIIYNPQIIGTSNSHFLLALRANHYSQKSHSPTPEKSLCGCVAVHACRIPRCDLIHEKHPCFVPLYEVVMLHKRGSEKGNK